MATEAKLYSLQPKQNTIVHVFFTVKKRGLGARHPLFRLPTQWGSHNLSLVYCPSLQMLLVVQVIRKVASRFLQLHRGSPFLKCTPHSESRRQLMRDYLLPVAWHTPHHNLQLVQFMAICCSDLPLPFPRLHHKHHSNVLEVYQL